MGKVKIGVAIGRRAGRLVVAEGDQVRFDREVARSPATAPRVVLRELLAGLPETFKGKPLAIGLSSGDLACDDVWDAPEGFRTKDVAAVAPVLLEARSTGETLERLAIDVKSRNGQLLAVAVSADELAALREIARLRLVTSLPAALADAFPESRTIAWAGQRIDVAATGGKLSWRSTPIDHSEESAAPTIALAVALANGDAVPDALRGASDAPRSFGGRFRTPLRAIALASALLLGAVGFFFRAERARFETELAVAVQAEQALWQRHFADRTPVRGDLLRAVKDRLRDSGQGAPGEATLPSAFHFWLELGKHLPDVEALGLSLESLDVSPEGGRLAAAVAAVPGDALRNAALLEAKVNESPKLSARGDYEARERDVQVRLKMDYRSR